MTPLRRLGRLLGPAALLLAAPAATGAATSTATTQTASAPPGSLTASVTSSSLRSTGATTAPATTSTSSTTASSMVTRINAGARLGDPPVAVVDFAFHPGSLTIHAGDTVSWTNSGAQPHTATANDRSFDTGILRPGQSASHTFARAGTFTYFCTVHPFMHGTVVVLPGAGAAQAPRASTPPGGAAPAAAGSPGASQPASPDVTPAPAPTLPLTGLPVLEAVLLGVGLIAVGGTGYLLLRRSESRG